MTELLHPIQVRISTEARDAIQDVLDAEGVSLSQLLEAWGARIAAAQSGERDAPEHEWEWWATLISEARQVQADRRRRR